ncbi:Major cardiolipin synthase ClsA [termite gut metagenome]|uniref:Major cardiolipin synthase ClsA n=1 Tax=termite gut metagenome TaxID=433724 RepID=A0A5J4RXN7_9ZZZZ
MFFDWNHILTQIATIAFELIYLGVIIGAIVVVILDNGYPVKTIAWVLVLAFLPFAGLIFYFFFGRNIHRQRIISRKSYNRLLKKPMAEYLAQNASEIPEEYSRLIQFFQNTNQSFPFDGNRVEIYTDGFTKMQALICELQKAKHHIHIEYYLIEDDPVGRSVRSVLIEKAKQGVEVRFIYDDVGCWTLKDNFLKEMRDVGIEVKAFLEVHFPLLTSKVNYRNHRKIVVIDGCVGFVGGMNLAERYVNGLSWGLWRDMHILIEGKVVHGLQTAFLLDWYFVSRTLITSFEYFPRIKPCGSILAQIVTANPISQWKEIMQGLILAISGAKKYFYMQTPYFLPTDPVLIAIQTAALSGVDVRLMIPKRADNRITNLGSHSYMTDLLRAGVKVYFYKKGFLHAKLIVSDDKLSTVGSSNIDFRSFEHNFEVNAFLYDMDTALRMKDIFIKDQHQSTQIYLRHWQKRPLHTKVAESVVRLFSPLL